MYFLTKDLMDTFFMNDFEEFPKFKIIDKKNFLEVKGIIPGFDKENLEIGVIADTLIVKGNGGENSSKFEKKFHLDTEKLDSEKIECNLKNGILTIIVNKKEDKKVYNKILIA
jgi:HSP20 family molecular chaperone IbpA